jgi:hypothetical protein
MAVPLLFQRYWRQAWDASSALVCSYARATRIFLDFGLAGGKINTVPGASSFAKAMED